MKPTYDELLKIIDAQQKTIMRLEKRVTDLESRLNLNSTNSSKPPSSDRKKNKRPPCGGAKVGHTGHHRLPYSEDQVSKHLHISLEKCSFCGFDKLRKKAVSVFQQVELPEVQPWITQIELEKAVCCGCQRHLTAPFPSDYNRTVFGPKLTACIGSFSSVYRMSKRNIQMLLKELFCIDISLGSIPAVEKRLSQSLSSAYASLFDRINKKRTAYVDETSFRQQAKTHYVWTVTTDTESFIRILPTRSLASLSVIRPREHKGITVTDRYAAYAYQRHQYCLAHIKRDFKKFSQRDGPDKEIAEAALFELKEIFIACYLSCRKTMRQRVGYRKRKLWYILCDAIGNGSEKFSKFADKLLDQFHKLFLFTRYGEVECTNNAAERTLRHIVLWRKTSYGTQSEAGSRFLERAVSIWMTLKKQGRHTLSFFEQAYRASFNLQIKPPTIIAH